MKKDSFQSLVWKFYKKNKRDLPWRKTRDQYAILVSEIMLQQTQVARVIPKYEMWMKTFPTLESLASTSVSDVLSLWQGLGYNRRGLNLKRIAEVVVKEYKGTFPRTYPELLQLPGIGPYTANAILAFAFNKPVVMIETNIRTVFLHHFFQNKENVHDKDLLPYIEKTLDHESPRKWYYALMDYGAYLKSTLPNPSRRSAHHTKQTRFEGSRRQARAAILRHILKNHPTKPLNILKNAGLSNQWTMEEILSELEAEGFIAKRGNAYVIQ